MNIMIMKSFIDKSGCLLRKPLVYVILLCGKSQTQK